MATITITTPTMAPTGVLLFAFVAVEVEEAAGRAPLVVAGGVVAKTLVLSEFVYQRDETRIKDRCLTRTCI